MDESLSLFLSDCSTQLDVLESGLLQLERNPAEPLALDTIFRATHTIKGNAMVVQQGEVEWFAHVAESVLMRLRDGALRADSELVSVLLACCDHLRFLVGIASFEETISPDFADEDRARLIGLLVPYLGDADCVASPPEPPPYVAPRLATRADECWHVRVRFVPEVLQQGLDPAYFLRHLAQIGIIFSLQTHVDGIPDLPAYDPELCYLRFEVWLDTPADKQAIEDVFSFVHEGCELQISPPGEQLKGYVGRIQALPDTDLHTGEMLMRVGALTLAELDSGLRMQRSVSGEGKPLGHILVDEGFVPSALVDAVLLRQDQIKQEHVRESRQLRVSTEQLEQLLSCVSALQCELEALTQRGGSVAASEVKRLGKGLEEARRLTEDLRSTRFGEQFRRLQRVVRDTAQALGKRADLLTEGADLILERSASDLLSDALMHLLRNAIDHGLESPAERLRVGKPAHGMLSVTGREDGEWLVFTVSDDGAGIDCDKVRAVAIAAGLLPEGARPDAESIYALLFEPGFSTADAVTHYSGRGVGLDVVRDAVLALGGELKVQSARGLGSRFEIRLPGMSAEADAEAILTASQINLTAIEGFSES